MKSKPGPGVALQIARNLPNLAPGAVGSVEQGSNKVSVFGITFSLNGFSGWTLNDGNRSTFHV